MYIVYDPCALRRPACVVQFKAVGSSENLGGLVEMKVLSMDQVLEKCLDIGGGQLSLQPCVYPSDGPVFTTRPCV